jgi:hypothetical protein
MVNKKTKSSARQIAAARLNGSYGGEARADRHDGAVLSEWASRGGEAVLAKYGREYFVELRKRRTNYPKDTESPLTRPNWRSLAARANAQHGGNARAALYSREHLTEWARLGGVATQSQHGNEFFKEIRKKRTQYAKGYLTRKTKARLREQAVHNAKTEKNWAIAALWKGALSSLE